MKKHELLKVFNPPIPKITKSPYLSCWSCDSLDSSMDGEFVAFASLKKIIVLKQHLNKQFKFHQEINPFNDSGEINEIVVAFEININRMFIFQQNIKNQQTFGYIQIFILNKDLNWTLEHSTYLENYNRFNVLPNQQVIFSKLGYFVIKIFTYCVEQKIFQNNQILNYPQSEDNSAYEIFFNRLSNQLFIHHDYSILILQQNKKKQWKKIQTIQFVYRTPEDIFHVNSQFYWFNKQEQVNYLKFNNKLQLYTHFQIGQIFKKTIRKFIIPHNDQSLIITQKNLRQKWQQKFKLFIINENNTIVLYKEIKLPFNFKIEIFKVSNNIKHLYCSKHRIRCNYKYIIEVDKFC